MSYRFERNGRSLTALLVLGMIWGALLLAWGWLDASSWIIAVLLAFTLPALWDFLSARPAGLSLDGQRIRWWSGRHQGDVRLETIDHARFDTRLDLSVRVRLVLANASKTRVPIPQDALPRWQELQTELEARGITVQRHHFSLM
ncbi:hypothetical protein [Primorskyibacter sp. 2E233]|uniref:hypothetical protein n=1 Tax=Primorskyibacter sp. 2E233 TaxID=3413431 RepID=UPI003BEF4D15